MAQTMRYLGLVPKDKSPDGKHDWSSGHFYFNAEVCHGYLSTSMTCLHVRWHR
jgi:hypothetical protein